MPLLLDRQKMMIERIRQLESEEEITNLVTVVRRDAAIDVQQEIENIKSMNETWVAISIENERARNEALEAANKVSEETLHRQGKAAATKGTWHERAWEAIQSCIVEVWLESPIVRLIRRAKSSPHAREHAIQQKWDDPQELERMDGSDDCCETSQDSENSDSYGTFIVSVSFLFVRDKDNNTYVECLSCCRW
jgi:hypothetical protein